MKPARFEYHVPATTTDALELLAAHGDDAKVLAGGQSLVPILALRLSRFEHLVDLNRVGELAGIASDAGRVVVGAMTRQRAVERSEAVARAAPLLARATPLIGHFQIRNRGTVGGSLAHADPASEYPAVAVAVDAELEVASAQGRRRVGAADFFEGTWTTVLEPDELLVAAHFPVWEGRTGFAIEEFARRHGDFAVAGVACALAQSDGGAVERAGIALFGVGSTPVRAFEAEAALTSGATVAEAADVAVRDLNPVDDVHASAATRRSITRHLIERALERARREASSTDAPAARPVPRAPARSSAPDEAPTVVPGGGPTPITVTVNGERRRGVVEPRRTLADFLREECALTGTHLGCEHGVCGACTVLVDDDAVRSCLLFAVQADGREVTTVEGIGGADGALSPVQDAFREEHGLQCGFCTPGFVVSVTAMLRDEPSLSDDEVRAALAGNLCRCTGYQGIVRAVHRAADGAERAS